MPMCLLWQVDPDMSRTVWLEAALNGPWTRARQPRIPITVDEIVDEGIACAEAGAAIIHLHAYDADAGVQNDDWQIYARIIESIRAKVDAIVYPTIPFPGSATSSATISAEARFAHADELGKRGLIEWCVVDPGTVNFARFDSLRDGDIGFVYLNPEEHIRQGLELARTHRFHPSYAIYEPGFTRLGAGLARAVPGVPVPIYRFMFSTEFAWGFPPEAFALDAHLRLLEREAPGAPWMIGGLGVDVAGLIETAVLQGGHVRVGLEDAPHGIDCRNLDLVADAVRMIEHSGAQPASADEVRAALKVSKSPERT